VTKTKLRQPPRGWKAFFWRAPIFFYHIGLGWLFGERFLLLNHIGRKSGLPRQAVLEVVHQNEEAYFIVSGFGEKSQWFKNLLHTPQVNIQVGRKKMSVQAEHLSISEAFKILRNYADVHPRALRELSRLIGISYNGSEEDLQNMANLLPILALHVQ
jgi:deazaflavin-dependent oxidoreductase (nitroreductase family)